MKLSDIKEEKLELNENTKKELEERKREKKAIFHEKVKKMLGLK